MACIWITANLINPVLEEPVFPYLYEENDCLFHIVCFILFVVYFYSRFVLVLCSSVMQQFPLMPAMEDIRLLSLPPEYQEFYAT